MPVQYKLSNAAICLKRACFKTSFLLGKDITRLAILGTPFVGLLYPFEVSEQGIISKANDGLVCLKFSTKAEWHEINNLKSKIEEKEKVLFSLKKEIIEKTMKEKISSPKLQLEIEDFKEKLAKEVFANIPNAFWSRNKFVVELPYEPDFRETMIPTKARPIQMNERHLEICKKEIEGLLAKKSY